MRRRLFLGTVPLAAAAQRVSGAAAERKFQLGSVTYQLFQNADLETTITELEKAGYAAVELRTTHKHGVEPSLSPAERKQVRDRFARSKVRLLSYGTTCRFQSPDTAERRRQVDIAKSFIDLAHDTGARGIKLQPQGFAPGVSKETTIEYFGEAMRELGEYGRPLGVETWMEVHGRGTSDPPVAAAMLKAANHPNVGACWNSNPTDLVNGSIQSSFELLRPWIRNVHLHDLTDPAYPFRDLFRLLQQSGYSGYTLAEVPESKETARFLAYYKSLWAELNGPC
jgi:sugar phosphate isomerase/epimerase